jgi:hypothetical protein
MLGGTSLSIGERYDAFCHVIIMRCKPILILAVSNL